VREFGSVDFQPPYADARTGKYARFELRTVLRSQDGGAFQLSKGVGVAVVVEKTSDQEIALAGADTRPQGFIRIDDVELTFVPRPRNDDVTV
jgi:hypothetical protein